MDEDDIFYIASCNKNVILDTKKALLEYCKNIKFIKINEVEYEATKHTLATYGDFLNSLIITKGKNGCVYKNKVYPVPKKFDTIDISGAGDTFLAAFGVKYTETKNIELAIEFAQKCTSSVIRQKGVSTVKLEDVN